MNEIIRNSAKEKHVCLWQIAEIIGCNDGNFSRKLRKELPQEQTEKILNIIDELSKRNSI